MDYVNKKTFTSPTFHLPGFSVVLRRGLTYLEGKKGGASFADFDFRKEDRISRGIQKRRGKKIPTPMDPNMV